MSKATNEHLFDLIERKAREDGSYAIAHALMRLSDAQEQVAKHLGEIGLSGPVNAPGALEFIGMELRDIKESFATIAEAVGNSD